MSHSPLVFAAALACRAPAPAPVAAVAPPAPAPAPAVVAAPPSWPASALPGVPGWPGVRTGGEDSHFAGITGTTHLVVLDAEPWRGNAPGATATAVSTAGATSVRFAGVQTGRFGCDGGAEVPAAAFEAAPTDAAVWLLPDATVAARALPVNRADTAEERVWNVGTTQTGLTRTGTYTATWWAGADRRPIQAIDVGADLMDGYERQPIALGEDFLVPQVFAAWDVGGAVIVAAAWASFEGYHLTLVNLSATPSTPVDAGYLYGCAF